MKNSKSVVELPQSQFSKDEYLNNPRIVTVTMKRSSVIFWLVVLIVSAIIANAIRANRKTDTCQAQGRIGEAASTETASAKEGNVKPMTDATSYSSPISTEDQELVERMRGYLEGKASPLAPFSEVIVEKGRKYGVNPILYVGVANAESSLAKNFAIEGCTWEATFNAVGMKPASRHSLTPCRSDFARYASPEEAIEDFFVLMSSRTYYGSGLDTVDEIQSRWVGHRSKRWIENVSAPFLEI